MRDSTKMTLVAVSFLIVGAVGTRLLLSVGSGIDSEPTATGPPPLIETSSEMDRESVRHDVLLDLEHPQPSPGEQPVSPADPDSPPWFVDMSHVPMTGLNMREYVALWHPEIWPKIEESTLNDSFFDFEFESEIELGEPLPCLRRMPELLMASFESQPRGQRGLYNKLNALPGTSSSELHGSGLHSLKYITSDYPIYNPDGRDIAQSGPEWDQAVLWLDGEVRALGDYVDHFIDEVRAAMRSDLEGLSPTQAPRYGKIMFGPFHTRDHPDHPTRKELAPYYVAIWAGDTINDCKKFTASYILALEDHPALADSVRELRLYKEDLFNRIKATVDGLP